MEIKSVFEGSFNVYGRIIKDYAIDDVTAVMENETPLPEDVVYVASVKALEDTTFFAAMTEFFGGLPVQIGYCNGHNQFLNAVEYHRCSEINVAITDMILLIGRQQDITEDLEYDTAKIEAFFVPAGTVVEMYGTTLHYAPCGVDGKGFRCIVVLPKGTNEALTIAPATTVEDKLLTAANKWLIAHEDANIKGAFNGLRGENLSV